LDESALVALGVLMEEATGTLVEALQARASERGEVKGLRGYHRRDAMRTLQAHLPLPTPGQVRVGGGGGKRKRAMFAAAKGVVGAVFGAEAGGKEGKVKRALQRAVLAQGEKDEEGESDR
jgi:hypothetical protein